MFNIKTVTGIEKVYLNLCKGFDALGIKYTKNLSFNKIKPEDAVIVLGDELYQGKDLLKSYNKPNKIIAGIGLITHPSEWPELFNDYPVAVYLQHCMWANNLYIKYYGHDKCAEWPAGVDTEKWIPANNIEKKYDFLVYNKIRWDNENQEITLKKPIIAKLDQANLSYCEIKYGAYLETDYIRLLKQSKAVIFICEHETQGFACCEAMSMDIPILAWNPGFCRDPNRFIWNDAVIETSTVPFFDHRCGLTFLDFDDFNIKIEYFLQSLNNGEYNPRAYIMENLTLKKSAERMLEIINDVYN
ncbi:glycosyltransferase family 1 protein [Pedobacter aquatilis]|uniref:glycosyltransferase n=1 Tax=Pedobacter aquatilis TaxID=351343 RepID=UPI00292E5CA1|nr:glycosyltransferase family 1 protein [Pedobacter aquatilis]